MTSSADVNEPVTSEAGVHKFWVYAAVLVGIVVVVWGLVTAHQREAERKAAAFKAGAAAVAKNIPEMVKAIRHREPGGDGLEPARIWDGSAARIVLIEQRDSESRFSGPYRQWSVLAQTTRGRFFAAQFRMSHNCEKADETCGSFEGLRPLNESQAKDYLFSRGKSLLYEEVFKEKMPPTEVPA